MAQAVTVYRWDDPGAPQLIAGKPSEVINVLKKCLVEGYGTQSGLGWSMIAEDVPGLRVAFQNSVVSGSGGAVQFESVDGTDANKTALRIKSGQSFIGFDEFYNAGPNKLMQIVEQSMQWVVIGTPTAFYFISADTADSITNWARHYYCGLFCGDYIANKSNDAGRFIVLSQGAAVGVDVSLTTYRGQSWTNAFACYLGEYGSPRDLLRLYDADGSPQSKQYSVYPSFMRSSTAEKPTGQVAQYFSKLYIQTDFSFVDFVRGELPGMVHSPTPMHRDQKYPLIYDINGTAYFAVPASANAIKFYINMEQW